MTLHVAPEALPVALLGTRKLTGTEKDHKCNVTVWAILLQEVWTGPYPYNPTQAVGAYYQFILAFSEFFPALGQFCAYLLFRTSCASWWQWGYPCLLVPYVCSWAEDFLPTLVSKLWERPMRAYLWNQKQVTMAAFKCPHWLPPCLCVWSCGGLTGWRVLVQSQAWMNTQPAQRQRWLTPRVQRTALCRGTKRVSERPRSSVSQARWSRNRIWSQWIGNQWPSTS